MQYPVSSINYFNILNTIYYILHTFMYAFFALALIHILGLTSPGAHREKTY